MTFIWFVLRLKIVVNKHVFYDICVKLLSCIFDLIILLCAHNWLREWIEFTAQDWSA